MKLVKSLISAAVLIAAGLQAAVAAAPGVTITGPGAPVVGDWLVGSFQQGTVTSDADSFTLAWAGSGNPGQPDFGYLGLNLTGLTANATYTVNFGAQGFGWLDVMDLSATVVSSPDGDIFPNVSGNENSSANAADVQVARPGFAVDLDSEVFGVNNAAGGAYSLTFTNGSSATATLFMKTLTGSSITVGSVEGFSSPIPEPETYAMMLAGLGAVGLMGRRRRAR